MPAPKLHHLSQVVDRSGVCAVCGPVPLFAHPSGLICGRTPEHRAVQRLRRLFNLTPQDVADRLAAQDGCAICHTWEPGPKGWAVDHDHTCCPATNNHRKTCGLCVRGILCYPCNTGIGLLGDSPARLIAAAKYLTETA